MTPVRDTQSEMVRAAIRAIRPGKGDGPLVRLILNGAHVFGELEVDDFEHARREAIGIGSVTSTGLLHALWKVAPCPGGVDNALSQADRHTLGAAHPGLAFEHNGVFSRAYRPSVRIKLLVTLRVRADPAIRRSLAMPPIFQRLAIWKTGSQDSVAPMSAYAADRGVGQLQLSNPDKPRLIAMPGPPVPSVPTVYQWWLSELAYHQLLKSTQELNWALGSTSIAAKLS